MNGAGSRIRTDDLLITNQLLYQLSYAGKMRRKLARTSHLSNKSAASTAIRAAPRIVVTRVINWMQIGRFTS